MATFEKLGYSLHQHMTSGHTKFRLPRWNQFESIPWPDPASLWVSTCIHGQDERGRLMRRTIVRYLNLSLILVFRLVSLPVKKRFPTLDHLLAAGILEPKELEVRMEFWSQPWSSLVEGDEQQY